MIRSNPHTQRIHPPGAIVTLKDYINYVKEVEMNKTVYIEHGSRDYERMFQSLGFTVIDNPYKASLVCFTGGEDVSPEIYGDIKHPFTHNNPYRDDKESRLFHECKKQGIPMVGICRGGQFLNVMNGGRMYQHVTGHTRPHYITDVESGEQVYVSSTHHQMMMPGSEAVLVASSAIMGTREWYDGEVFRRDVSDCDYEVLFYEQSKSLCFQPHPEFVTVEYEGLKRYFGSLLKKWLEV